eukprot:744703-Lingulodinium_polyedra.AAC.1
MVSGLILAKLVSEESLAMRRAYSSPDHNAATSNACCSSGFSILKNLWPPSGAQHPLCIVRMQLPIGGMP